MNIQLRTTKSLTRFLRPTKKVGPEFFNSFLHKTIPFRYAFTQKTAKNSLAATNLSGNGGIESGSKNTTGFTLVELLIASAVFSVVLLLCASALLQIGRVYYKGITSAQTQEVARSVMDEISRTIQFNGGPISVPPGGPNYRICVGDKVYTFLIDRQLSDNPTLPDQRSNVLVINSGSCVSQPIDTGPAPPGSRELLAPNMRLSKLIVTQVGSTNLYNINIRVVYGDSDILNASRDGCGPGRFGTQYCAASELSTVVEKRVK